MTSCFVVNLDFERDVKEFDILPYIKDCKNELIKSSVNKKISSTMVSPLERNDFTLNIKIGEEDFTITGTKYYYDVYPAPLKLQSIL